MKKKEQQQEQESKKNGTIVLSCTCTHEFQDDTYGMGKRLHNLSGAKGSKKARCTVCSKVVSL